eukprot:8304656-Pyramimonas_sp.AAC.1
MASFPLKVHHQRAHLVGGEKRVFSITQVACTSTENASYAVWYQPKQREQETTDQGAQYERQPAQRENFSLGSFKVPLPSTSGTQYPCANAVVRISPYIDAITAFI